jgi:hypothetical protein
MTVKVNLAIIKDCLKHVFKIYSELYYAKLNSKVGNLQSKM